MNQKVKFLILIAILIINAKANSQVVPKNKWWMDEPWRLIQTNLRETDAIDFDVDVYVNSLVDMGASAVLINVGGIVANYYTGLEFHYRNPNLKFNLIADVIERLHEKGIRVIGRFDFSKLNESLAAKKPGWLYKSVKGESVNYNGQVHTCVNGGYQQEYSLKIIEEALTLFPLDGVFFNMIGYQVRDYSNNYHGICQSDACRERFRKWSGGLDLPKTEDYDDPVFRKYSQFKSETSNELFFRIHDLIRSFGEHLAINTYTHAGTDFYRRESGSEMFTNRVDWEYHSAHNVKSVLGSWKDKKVSNAAVHFIDYPARHSSVSPWLTEQRLIQNLLYGAGVDFYCIGRLDNLEDRTVLLNVKNAFQFHRENEKYMIGIDSGNKALLLHDGQSENEYRGLFELLAENHILFDVREHWRITGEDLSRELEEYELVILPEISRLSDADCERLDKYVEHGGKLLATGFISTRDESGNPLNRVRLKSLGVKPDYRTYGKEQGTYYRIFEKDKVRLDNELLRGLDLVYAWEEGMLCEITGDAKGYLGYIPPAMIGPPEKCYYTEVTEIPGLISNQYGKGKTAYFSFRIGSLFHHKRHYGHAALVMSSLQKLLDYQQDFQTNASPLIEISRQKSNTGSFEWFGLLNHSGQLGNAFHPPLPVVGLQISFFPAKPVKSVKVLQSGNELEYGILHDGRFQVILPVLNFYDIILIEY